MAYSSTPSAAVDTKSPTPSRPHAQAPSQGWFPSSKSGKNPSVSVEFTNEGTEATVAEELRVDVSSLAKGRLRPRSHRSRSAGQDRIVLPRLPSASSEAPVIQQPTSVRDMPGSRSLASPVAESRSCKMLSSKLAGMHSRGMHMAKWQALASGLYFARVDAEGQRVTKKLLLIR
jgi:hypothetical protein